MPRKKFPAYDGETRLEVEHRLDGQRRLAILSFIIEFSQQNGYAPSVRDIMPIVGLASSSTMHKVLSRMEKDELIQITQGVARSMRVLPKGLEMIH